MQKALHIGSDTHTLADIAECLKKGEMQAFWSDRAIIVTSIVDAPQKKYIEFFLSAGEMEPLLELYEQVKQWAIDQGADFGRAFVRPGFERIFAERGWKKKTVVMEFDPKEGK